MAVVPDLPISAATAIESRFRSHGATTLSEAAEALRRLPYGRASSPDLVLAENRGTCSSKHAAFVRLARATGLAASLIVELFEMNEDNTPGVGAVLDPAGMPSILEAHCRAELAGSALDLTGLVPGRTEAAVIEALPLEPADLHRKPQLHRARLAAWGRERHPGHSLDDLWAIRERCILALAEQETRR